MAVNINKGNGKKLGGIDDNTWAVFAHLGGFLGFVIPLGNVLTPLLIWIIRRDSSKFVGEQALEALNFQITMSIYFIIATALWIVLIGFILVPIVLLADVILMIMAAVQVSKGVGYRYPFTLRLVK